MSLGTMAKFSTVTNKIIEKRFLLKDRFGRVTETVDGMFRRVSHAVAQVEGQWGTLDEIDYYEGEFYNMMKKLEFIPGLPCLMNAGVPHGQLLSSYVVPVPDSVEGITQAVSEMSTLLKTGALCGFSFNQLRPSEDSVQNPQSSASGPVKFMRLFDTATDVINEGGVIQSQNTVVLPVSHPNVFDFAEAKANGALPNLKTFVAISSHFMRCLKKETTYPLVNPRNGQITQFVPASKIFDAICKATHASNYPGIIFIDEINRHNPTPQIGNIEAFSAETPLLDYEGSCQGFINLSDMIDDKGFDEERFEIIIDLAVRFLDNVIEATYYPLQESEKMTRANRKIGLGLCGFADLLMRLGIPYESPKAKTFATTMMKFLLKRARHASFALAKQRGPFDNYKGSLLEKLKIKNIRNATITTLSPSETASLFTNSSLGMSPVSHLSLTRSFNGSGSEQILCAPFQEFLQNNEMMDENIISKVQSTGTLKGISKLAQKGRSLFKVREEIAPEFQLKMQASFQKYTDNMVSQVISLPAKASVRDIYTMFMAAYQSKCKVILLERDSE